MDLSRSLALALQRPWLAVGIGVPMLTTLLLLWVDEFNLRGLLFVSSAGVEVSRLTTRTSTMPGRTTSLYAPKHIVDPPTTAKRIVELTTTAATTTSTTTVARQRSVTAPALSRPCVKPGAGPQPWPRRTAGPPQVGASIALHPPKFYAAAKFLEQFSSCPGAVETLLVVLVFTAAEDIQIFREVMACLSPDVPEDAFTAVVAVPPSGGWRRPVGAANQMIAAYKKWFGLAHMMDLGEEAPEYGFLVDAELLMYDNGGEDARGADCQLGGPWSRLLPRIRAQEASKSFPAARVGTMTTYSFGGGLVRSGKDYDRALIQENAHFALGNEWTNCDTAPCKEIQREIEDVLFSWWTDLPWTNLQVLTRMFTDVAGHPPKHGWRKLVSEVMWVRFEHIGYQQWCVMHEGFTFNDVTKITGEAKWGSYMEDPMEGARLDLLRPLWVSGEALERIENGALHPLSAEEPPLLIFHADKGRSRANREENKKRWEVYVLEILKKHGRHDYDQESIK